MPTFHITKLFWFFIFPFSVIVDFINGYFQQEKGNHLPIGFIYRGLIGVAILVYILKKRKITNYLFYSIVIVSLYFLSVFYWIHFTTFDLFVEFSEFFKLFYFLTIFFAIYPNAKAVDEQKLCNIVSQYGFLIAICIIYSFLSGDGISTYNGYGFGTKSYFKAGNDLGLTLLLAAVFSLLSFFYNMSIKKLIVTLCIIIACFLIGSRVGMAGACLLFLSGLFYFIFFYKVKGLKNKLLKGGMSLLCLIVLLKLFYVFADLYRSLDEYTLSRLSIDSIVSSRVPMTDITKVYIDEFNIVEVLVGKGTSSLFWTISRYLQKEAEYQCVEADFYEIVGSFGFFLGGLIICFPCYWVCRSCINYIKNRSLKNYLLCFIFISFMIISFSAGHAIKNVMVAPVYAISIILLIRKNEGPNKELKM